MVCVCVRALNDGGWWTHLTWNLLGIVFQDWSYQHICNFRLWNTMCIQQHVLRDTMLKLTFEVLNKSPNIICIQVKVFSTSNWKGSPTYQTLALWIPYTKFLKFQGNQINTALWCEGDKHSQSQYVFIVQDCRVLVKHPWHKKYKQTLLALHPPLLRHKPKN